MIEEDYKIGWFIDDNGDKIHYAIVKLRSTENDKIHTLDDLLNSE